MDPFAEFTSKSVLEIAGELGVRSASVQKALVELGVHIDDPSSLVDPDLEEVLIEHLIDQGTVPSKFKRPKHVENEPFVSDDLVLEALGAGEDGFSEQRIPRQLRVESGFTEKPSWFEKLFGKKKENDVVRSLKEVERSPADLDALFSPVEARAKGILRTSSGLPAKGAFYERDDEIGEDHAPTIELSDDILDEFDDLDMDGIEDLADIELEGFEELGAEAASAKPQDETEEIEDAEVDLDEEQNEIENEDEVAEPEEGAAESEEETEEVIPAGVFERFMSRIHLTPAEMWTVTGGSLAIMLVLLGITVYWYWYKSPDANAELWKDANDTYKLAQDADGESTPAKQIVDYGEAASLFLQYINQFKEDSKVPQGFEMLCDSHFQKAKLHQLNGQADQMSEEFRQAIEYYDQFLAYIENQANKVSQQLSMLEITDENRAEMEEFKTQLLSQTVPNPEKQEIALYNIGYSYWQLGEYQEAVNAFKNYLNKFSGHERAPEVRLSIGEIYKEWAAKNTENEFELLEQAKFAFDEAIAALPENAHIAKMRLYKGLGEIKKKQFERRRSDNQIDAMHEPLNEAIAYLENSYDEAQAAGESLDPPDRIQVYKFLGDLNLTRGEIAVEKLEEFERVKADFRDGEYKDVIEKGASDKREEANFYLQNALALYNDLLENTKELIEDPDLYEILYNKANGHRLMKEFDNALSTAEELMAELQDIPATDELAHRMKVQNAYLLGHISWDKAKDDYIQDILAKRNQSINPSQYYTNVKKYYREALALDGFYPKEQNGIISHLADIRLTNVLYLQEKDYEQALIRFRIMVQLWPEDDYSYLTYYFYGKTLELYGDEKQAELENVNNEIRQFGITPQLYEQKNALETEMKQLYQEAIIQYGKAIEVRPNSQYVDIDDEKYLVEMHFHRGFSAFKQGNFINDSSKLDAESLLNKALQDYRNHPVAREKYVAPAIERLGDLYAGIGLYDTAVDKYREYIDNGYEDPNSNVRMKLADTYLTRLSFEEARLWYQRIITENPPPTKGDRDRARRMERTIESGPAFEAYKKLAQTYLTEATSSPDNRHQKLQEALKAYQEFARKYPIDPENEVRSKDEIRIPLDTDAQLKIGNIYDELEDYPNAAKNLLQFLDNNPNYPNKGQIYKKIGQAYIKAGMIDDAIDKLYLISDKDINNPALYADVKMNLAQAYQLKAREYFDQGDFVQYELRMQDAIKTYTEVIQTGVSDKSAEAQILQRGLWQELKNRQEQQQNLGG